MQHFQKTVYLVVDMKKYDKEVLQSLLDDEKKVIKNLTDNYIKALAGIKGKIKQLLVDAEETQLQSKIYQLQYQQALEKQISGYLKTLQSSNIKTVEEFLQQCYQDAFVGNIYSLQSQNIPLMFPVNQEQMLASIQKPTDGFKFSNRLYNNISELQQVVKAEIIRGVASNFSYADIARNIDRNMTLTDLAEALGISLSYVSDLIKEKRTNEDQLARIKNFLNLSDESDTA